MVLPVFSEPVRMEIEGRWWAQDSMALLQLERREFEAVLGVPVVFAVAGSNLRHRWTFRLDPAAPAPELRADFQRQCLTAVLPRPEDFGRSLNLLHLLAASEQSAVRWEPVETYEQVLRRVATALASIYPYWELRGLDREKADQPPREIAALSGDQFWEAVAQWVAALGDAHTSLVPPGNMHHPPYDAAMTGSGVQLMGVPADSAAAEAGVGPGWRIPVEEAEGWLRSTGASAQQHKYVAARRFMAMTSQKRVFTAYSPTGDSAVWEEERHQNEDFSAAGNSVRIARFTPSTPEKLAGHIQRMGWGQDLRIDLRGNTGGNLVSADRCRRLLLGEPGEYGWLQYSDGRGGLAAAQPLWLEPSDAGFSGNLEVLVDSMTYSAAEDFLHPLVGLNYVSIHGGPTGGGSGRPVTLPLMEGYSLRVSTAITYTADGTPVECFGITGSGN